MRYSASFMNRSARARMNFSERPHDLGIYFLSSLMSINNHPFKFMNPIAIHNGAMKGDNAVRGPSKSIWASSDWKEAQMLVYLCQLITRYVFAYRTSGCHHEVGFGGRVRYHGIPSAGGLGLDCAYHVQVVVSNCCGQIHPCLEQQVHILVPRLVAGIHLFPVPGYPGPTKNILQGFPCEP